MEIFIKYLIKEKRFDMGLDEFKSEEMIKKKKKAKKKVKRETEGGREFVSSSKSPEQETLRMNQPVS